jgi:Sulfotransferase family
MRSLLQISRAENRTSPVFIVGEARSGSTLLYRCLQKHPSFRTRDENLAESAIMRHIGDIRLFSAREPRSAFRYMARNRRLYSEFLESIQPVRKFARLGGIARRRVDSSQTRLRIWAASGSHLVIRSYFHHAKLARGSERLLEKTAGHVRHIDELLHCYPLAKLIYIYRHPVDVYTSYLKLARIEERRFDWVRRTVPKFPNRWAHRTECALEAADRLPDSFLMVRYEDFTADPEPEARRICDFIGERFDEVMVTEQQPRIDVRRGSPLIYSTIMAKTKNWQEYLTPTEARRLQAQLRPMMTRLAYEPY